MEPKTYLEHYRVCLDERGAPQELSVGGANVTAYKAEDTNAQRDVIVQLVPVAGLRVLVREKIEAEALAAKQINHLNLPAVCDFGLVGDQFVYVTEYFDGTSAHAWVAEHGPMPINAVLRVASQMVGALGAAAFHGIFHHAINPENIMLVAGQTTEGEWPLLKIVNLLGVAPSLNAGTISSARFDASASYASPEQLQNGKVDFRSEIYSLGCTLWFLLTGAPPLAGVGTVQAASGVPSAVKDLIAQMLAVNPSERPFDPLALQDQLNRCVAQVDRHAAMASKLRIAPATAAAAVRPSARRAISWKPLAIAALGLGLAALAAMVLPWRNRTPESIGVPIGVAEASAPSATNQPVVNSNPTTPLPPAQPAQESIARDPSTPRVLISTASAEDSEDSAANSQEVASNDATPDLQTEPEPSSQPPAPRTEEKTAEENFATVTEVTAPPPPSEGPAEPSSAAAPQTPVVAEAKPQADEPVAEAPHDVEAGTQSAPVVRSTPRAKSPVVARTTKRANKTVRYAGATDDMPPLPRHAVRAQYLGTTPDGELVFGLPSSERVYAAPAATHREPRPRRRRISRETIDELPVLPALPPGE